VHTTMPTWRARGPAALAALAALALLATGCIHHGWGGQHPPTPPKATSTSDQPTPAGATAPPATGLTGRIAYNGQDGDIWVMDADGSHRRQVTHSGAGDDFDPSWSPDGKRIVFRTSRGHHLPDPASLGLDGIFVVNADGSGERPIHPPTGGLFPDWSPDGSKIAFSGVLHPGDGDDYVFVMRPDGTHPTALHVDHTGECEEWSPDGSKLMFCSHWAGPFDVGVMHADGSHLRRLTDAPGNDYPGAWSPDGARIAFSSLRDGNGEVYVMNADGSKQTRLTHSPATYDAPDAWLPDGRIVVASSKENAPLPDWFVMDPDGTHIRSLPQLRGAQSPIDWLPHPTTRAS
jgi:Tol biopolymer transport system component